jgi:hypothetical protein
LSKFPKEGKFYEWYIPGVLVSFVASLVFQSELARLKFEPTVGEVAKYRLRLEDGDGPVTPANSQSFCTFKVVGKKDAKFVLSHSFEKINGNGTKTIQPGYSFLADLQLKCSTIGHAKGFDLPPDAILKRVAGPFGVCFPNKDVKVGDQWPLTVDADRVAKEVFEDLIPLPKANFKSKAFGNFNLTALTATSADIRSKVSCSFVATQVKKGVMQRLSVTVSSVQVGTISLATGLPNSLVRQTEMTVDFPGTSNHSRSIVRMVREN